MGAHTCLYVLIHSPCQFNFNSQLNRYTWLVVTSDVSSSNVYINYCKNILQYLALPASSFAKRAPVMGWAMWFRGSDPRLTLKCTEALINMQHGLPCWPEKLSLLLHDQNPSPWSESTVWVFACMCEWRWRCVCGTRKWTLSKRPAGQQESPVCPCTLIVLPPRDCRGFLVKWKLTTGFKEY